MKANSMTRAACALAAAALLTASVAWIGAAPAQQPTPTPSRRRPAAATPAPTPAPSPTPAASADARRRRDARAEPGNADPDNDRRRRNGRSDAQPAAYIEAKANRDEVYSSIMGSLATVRGEMSKADVKPAGQPIAVFLEADDDGFQISRGNSDRGGSRRQDASFPPP